MFLKSKLWLLFNFFSDDQIPTNVSNTCRDKCMYHDIKEQLGIKSDRKVRENKKLN